MKQLVSAIIGTLLAANVILTVQYKHDMNAYENKINNQSKIIQITKKRKRKLVELLRSQSTEIHILHSQIEKAKQINGKLKKKPNNMSKFVVTAYTPGFESTGKTIRDVDYKVTASGIKAKSGVTVACDPSIPFGTKLDIQNVGIRVCQDHGGKIKGNHIDVYFENLQTALNFGKQKLWVKFLD